MIITTYKRPDDVVRAVKSCINQTLKEIEIIVVDDNSPDSEYRTLTEKGIQPLLKDDRIIYIKHDKNMNGSVARNTGIRASKGEYISFLDDDDYYVPEKLETEYSVASALSDDYAGVLCNCYVERNGVIVKAQQTDSREQAVTAVLACNYSMGSGSNLFVRRDVVIEINGFDESLIRHQDLDFLVRVFLKYKLRKIEKPLFVVELFSSHLNVPSLEKLVTTKKKLYSKYETLIKSLPQEDQSEIMGNNYLKLYEAAIANKKYRIAYGYYKKSTEYSFIDRRKKHRMAAVFLYSIVPNGIKKYINRGR